MTPNVLACAVALVIAAIDVVLERPVFAALAPTKDPGHVAILAADLDAPMSLFCGADDGHRCRNSLGRRSTPPKRTSLPHNACAAGYGLEWGQLECLTLFRAK
jgi:hypothetical protein